MNYTHLVIIPCHGIWKGSLDNTSAAKDSIGDGRDEWFLAPFQIEGDDHLCFKEHVLKGYEIINKDPQALMVISGGRTKKESEDSEANSYLSLLKAVKGNEEVSDVVLEEFARDSFENVIFLLCKFYERCQRYPQSITIVGFEFKRGRFLENHLKQALMYPIDKVTYIGNEPNPPSNREAYFKDLTESEYKYAVKLFEVDYYGVQDPLLKKKLSRNPYNTFNNYGETNPLLKDIISAISDHSQLNNDEIQQTVSKTAPWL